MAVPRNRHSNARKNTRRAHHAKVVRQTSTCPSCEAQKLPHTICQDCGCYDKRQVLAIEAE